MSSNSVRSRLTAGEPPIVFAIRSYAYLAERVVAAGSFAVGQVEIRSFPDGERYLRVQTDVASRDVVLVGGTVSDTDTLELYDLASGLTAAGAHHLSLVIPFFGYATMERATKSGEVVTAKTRARLLSAIPPPGSGLSVFLLDLHVESLAHYFEGTIRPVHLYAKPVILEAVRTLGSKDFVLACTDAGRAKWVESLANDLGVQASFVFKRRLDDSHTEVIAMAAQVQGKDVVLYDDMIRTGDSLLSAAAAYRGAGARHIAAVATHGVFPGDALTRLRQSGLFSRIICTDSHPRAVALADDFLQVTSVARLLAGAVYDAS